LVLDLEKNGGREGGGGERGLGGRLVQLGAQMVLEVRCRVLRSWREIEAGGIGMEVGVVPGKVGRRGRRDEDC
jgi:hypothetical protein